MATGLSCFRCLYQILSGLQRRWVLSVPLIFKSFWGCKEEGGHFVGVICVVFCLFSCRSCRVEVWPWTRSVVFVGSIVLCGRGSCSYLWWLLRVCQVNLCMSCWDSVWAFKAGGISLVWDGAEEIYPCSSRSRIAGRYSIGSGRTSGLMSIIRVFLCVSFMADALIWKAYHADKFSHNQ